MFFKLERPNIKGSCRRSVGSLKFVFHIQCAVATVNRHEKDCKRQYFNVPTSLRLTFHPFALRNIPDIDKKQLV
jgi:hypothetical protein